MYLLNSWNPKALALRIFMLSSQLLLYHAYLNTLPAWDDFLSSELLNKMDAFLRKAYIKFGYTT